MARFDSFLQAYRQPSEARLRLYGSLWLMLWLTAVLGHKRKGELGTKQTLQRSAFARVMFMDIGALSTLGALYLLLTGKTRLSRPAALASLFVGGFALLPALTYEDWKALQKRV